MSADDTHYKTLEVPETASLDEIKKAYRKSSLKNHPDKNPGNPDAVRIFQKINEAYEVIGDAEKKNEYDMQRSNPFFRQQQQQGPGGGGMPPGFENMNDMFANLFFGGGMPGQGIPGMPGNIHMMGGMPGNIHMMGGMPGNIHMMGGGFPPGANIRIFRNGVPVNMTPQMEKPAPIIKTITISMELVLNGGKIPVEIEKWVIENGNKLTEISTVYVDVFKGIDNNEIILLKDQGNVINEQCKGDIKIFIKINNDSIFIRQGLDLLMNKDISLKESLCGFSFELKYINGKTFTINNQNGNIIIPEYQKIIPNMGLTREGHTGNLIIHFHVKFPETLSPEKIIQLKDIL